MLYIVATPIGNLEDMTFRSVRILKEVDYIFAEDTRVSKKLTNHYEIDTVVYRYDEHSKHRQTEVLMNLLRDGKTVALVSDAGTPCISDPGYDLVDKVLEEGIKVCPIPGASSIVAAASVAGINTRRMAFEGFFPKKKGRQTLLNKLKDEERAIVFLESPHRILRSLKDIKEYLGERYVVIAREITKIYEEVIRGNVSELIEKIEKKSLKGEMVVIIKAEEK